MGESRKQKTPSMAGVLLAATCWALCLAAACSSEEPPRLPDLAEPEPPCDALRWTEPPRKRNVVLILSDTTQRDRLGIHGGPARTPVFDRFASENLYFTEAYSQAPWTKPSIATLFTGLYPSQHSVATHPWLQDAEAPDGQIRDLNDIIETDVLGEDLFTLAEMMLGAGYRTAAFVSNPWLGKRHGFGQGFEVYDDSLKGVDPSGHTVSEAGIRWLRELPEDERFFLYLHYMDSHKPYGRVSRKEVAERREEIAADSRSMNPGKYGRSVISRLALFEDGSPVVESGIPPTLALLELIYDQGIGEFDRALGEFLEALFTLPGSEETVVIVTSDHGEALFTRGWSDHGYGFFDDELAIPMAVRLPGMSGPSPIECPVGLIDVMATLCVYLGLECPEGENFGVSFVAPYSHRWIFGRGANDDRNSRYLASEGVLRKPRHRVIRNRHFKLMFEPDGRFQQRAKRPYSLFAIAPDGSEERDLLSPDHRSSEIEPVFSKLAAGLGDAVVPVEARDVETVPLDAETREQLEALGYLE